GIRDFHVTGVQTCALPILADTARLEVAAHALGEAVESGGDGGKVLAVLAGQVPGRAGGQAVAGQDDRLADAGDALHQVVQEPVQLPLVGRVVAGRVRCGHRPSPL